MKKQTEKTITCCDNCQTDEHVFNNCAGCGKDFCFNCDKSKNVGQKFSGAVSFSGSGDCYICTTCLANPTPTVQAILAAYLTIRQLRNESKAFYENFEKRVKEAEAKVRIIVSKYNL